MRKLALASAALLLPIALSGQSQTDSVRITVRNLTFVGATQIPVAEQQQIAAEINNLTASADSVDGISERLRYTLQERGFFKAFAATPDVTIVSSSLSEKVIDVTYQVDLGQQYRLKQISFSNDANPKKGLAFDTSELRRSFPIADGEIFDTEKIRMGLEKLRELYASNGFINFIPVPNTEADDASATIVLRLDLDEGGIFRVGRLLLEGVEPAPGLGAKLLQAWKPYEGHVYSEHFLDCYMRENASYFPGSTATWRFDRVQNAEHHVVNFVLEFDDPIAAN